MTHNIFAGYWQREEATKAAFVRMVTLRTGDLATRSPDRYYTLSGRQSDLIITSGFNVYPREIEEFLQEQPEISEAAVKGVEDRALRWRSAGGLGGCAVWPDSMPVDHGRTAAALRCFV